MGRAMGRKPGPRVRSPGTLSPHASDHEIHLDHSAVLFQGL